MGLDAFVYCDCYEKSRLREPPPGGIPLRVYPDGSWSRVQDDGTLASDLAWDDWLLQRACEHRGGMLLHHRLGNISLIGLLRSQLQCESERFRILVTKVLYSGSHSGDFLRIDEIPALQMELEHLREFRCSSCEADRFMSVFRERMSELATTALSVGKPIAF
jgi:hypothetical protein